MLFFVISRARTLARPRALSFFIVSDQRSRYTRGMLRSQFLESLCVISASVPIAAEAASPVRNVAGIAIPDTALAREALALARAHEAPQIFNHALRTFFFAEFIARHDKVQHDAELVFIASILHDLGLSDEYMSDTQRFEVDGANAARALMSERAPIASTDLVWDAISLHDQSGIARWKQAEVRLVNAGVGADFGAYLDKMDRLDIRSVLDAAPRSNFIPVFLDAVARVAKKKPNATGNSFVTDVGYRMVPGFHLDNFCDEVKDDPFLAYARG